MKTRSMMRLMAFATVLIALCVVPEIAPSQVTGVLGVSVTRDSRVPLGFPVAWYDQVYNHGSYPDMQAEGTNSVIPYGTGSGVPTLLNAASAAGLGVYVQVDPVKVKAGDVAGVVADVNTYKSSPAVRGWYLADEPTISGIMTPTSGVTFYNAIKAADPVHPVAIAFYVTEDISSFAGAMDVIGWDFYPCAAGSSEFAQLDLWHTYLVRAANTWRGSYDFIPIVQAFGSNGTKYTQWRVPTADEERYMVYSVLQTGVDGMFFWSHYASDPTWRTDVFDPLMAQVRPLLPAVAAGRIAGASTKAPDVSVSLFRDPTTKRYVLIAVHTGMSTERATVHLPRFVPSRTHRITATYGPYAVKVVRF